MMMIPVYLFENAAKVNGTETQIMVQGCKQGSGREAYFLIKKAANSSATSTQIHPIGK